MSLAFGVLVGGLFLGALIAKFVSDAATNPRRKLVWWRVTQVSYSALVVVLTVKLAPLAWPYIKKVLAAQ